MSANKKDLVRKRYFRNHSRQADLLNACIKGYNLPVQEKKTWKYFTKDDFSECDSELYTSVGEKGKKRQRNRVVDSIRMVTCDEGMFYLILENQERVDYSMPVRILNHESIFYHEQVKSLEMEHKQKNELHTPEEWFSGIKMKDRLIPAISLILYYGAEPWDGAQDMSQLLQTKGIPEELMALIRNYSMNLIQIKDIDYLEAFQTDLHETFGFIKYQYNNSKLSQFVEENREKFQNLPEDAYDFITCQTGTRKLEQFKLQCKTREGNYNMCKALDDWEKENIERGVQLGIQQSEHTNAVKFTRMLFKNGASMELVAASILVLSREEIEKIYKEICTSS